MRKILLMLMIVAMVGVVFISGCTSQSPINQTNSNLSNTNQNNTIKTNQSTSTSQQQNTPQITQTNKVINGITFVEKKDVQNGYVIQYPSGWFAGVEENKYIKVEDAQDKSNVIIWPVAMSGNYSKANALDMANYLVGQLKKNYTDFQTTKIYISNDKTVVEITAEYNRAGTKTKAIFTTITKNNATFMSSYAVPVDQFSSQEQMLRQIISSFEMIGIKSSVNAQAMQLVDWTDPTISRSMTAKIPKSWKAEILPDCTTHALRFYDPNSPANQIFKYQELLFYGDSNMREIARADKQSRKDNCVYNAPQFGISMQDCYNYVDASLSYTDNPVIENTPRAFLTKGLPEMYHLDNVQKYLSWSPHLDNVNVLYEGSASAEIEALYSAYNFKTATIIADFTEEGKPAVGVFLIATGPVDMTGMWMGSIIGYSTEPDKFAQLSPSIIQSIASFQFTPEFVSSCKKAMDMRADAIAKNYQTIQETNDIIKSKYSYKQLSENRLSEEWSDATLGLGRVYNADNGEVYHVDNSFYDYYNTHREQYEMQNLQPLSQGQWGLVPLDGNLNIK